MLKRLAALLLLCLLPLNAAHARDLPTPKLIAIYFYADWCPICQQLTPKLAEARKTAELDKKDILFVTLNLTDKTTIHQAKLLAVSLGVGDFLKAQGSGTGYIAVLDAATKKELFRLAGDATPDTISKQLSDALK